jgi:hypothetical protein
MDFLNPGRAGYKYLSNKHDNSSTSTKEDAEFIRTRSVEVSGWLNSLTTLHLITALNKSLEGYTSKMLTCDKVEELKYLQGRIDGVKSVLVRISALQETVKKNLREA